MSFARNSSVSSFFLDENTVDGNQNIWLNILNGVQENCLIKPSSCKTLLVLGDDESGKTSLIVKLQEKENPVKGSGLEYSSINFRDECGDDHTRVSVWILDGDPWHKNLLKFALPTENIPETVVLLTASMARPWDILRSLHLWALVLEEHIDKLQIGDMMDQYKDNLRKKCQACGNLYNGIESITLRQSIGGDNSIMPLDEHILSVNLGLEIIVVITKTDYISTLEKDFDYNDEHFDFIQQALRKFCLKYGASLLYTSVKENKNCDLLSKYLVHKIYPYSFIIPASFVEKDAVFIPAGWDNLNKISVLYENFVTVGPDDPYDEVIVKPLVRNPFQREEKGVVSDDDQAFLFRLQKLLNQEVPSHYGPPQDSSIRFLAGVQKTSDRRLSGSPPGGHVYSKTIDGKLLPVGNESIQQTFNNLLNKRTGSSMQKPHNSQYKPNAP